MIRIFISNPEALTAMREKPQNLIVTLLQKMNSLMIQLQSRIVGESIPAFFKTYENIAATVQAQPAYVEGASLVHGEVQYGGPRTTKRTLSSGQVVDYAAVQERGGTRAYTIVPFQKKALAFMRQGNLIIVRSVYHPPLEARPFARSELQNMEGQIVDGLREALRESLGGTEAAA